LLRHSFLFLMKKVFTCTAIALCAAVTLSPARAHGWHDGGWGYPLAAGMIVGAGIYAASTPYAYPAYGYPAQVVYQVATAVVAAPPANPVPVVPRTAYYCQTTKQFYSSVPNCSVPWKQVTVY
jgi:hypothetical protein